MEKTVKKIAWCSFLTLIMVVIIGVGLFIKQKDIQSQLSSVSVTSEYNATTTPASSTWTDRQLDTGQGTLGSVIITTSGNLQFDLLNATTTDVTKRTNNKATSTILLASFPASTAADVWTFDVNYFYGLYLDVIAGTLGTSTITWR